MKKLLAAATLLVLSGQAQAHDLWLEREGEGFGLYYGHKHAGHEGVKFMEYKHSADLNFELPEE
jgi:nickel transport protein